MPWETGFLTTYRFMRHMKNRDQPIPAIRPAVLAGRDRYCPKDGARNV